MAILLNLVKYYTRPHYRILCFCRNRYCGSVPPPVVTSVGNMLMVKFVSDSSISSDGFSASFVTLNATTGTIKKKLFYRAWHDS